MRVRLALALAPALALALTSAGCVLAPIEERALAKLAAQLPVPPGIVDASVHTGCAGSCWKPSTAYADVTTHYPGGTNVTLLTLALRDVLAQASWNVTRYAEPTTWSGATSTDGGAVDATQGSLVAACLVGRDADLSVRVTITCRVTRP